MATPNPPLEGGGTSGSDDWETVARRTKTVAEQWKKLHAEEEARAKSSEQQIGQALAAQRKAEQERDAAMKNEALAKKGLVAAKQERARWKSRSEGQTASKVFLELEEARAHLQNANNQLAHMEGAYVKLRNEFDEFRARRKKDTEDEKTATRNRYETLMRDREDAVGQATYYEKETWSLRNQLQDRIAAAPPGALEAAQAQIERHETAIRSLEQRNAGLRREVARWRERARGALASERLTMLQSGPLSIPAPPLDGGSSVFGAGIDKAAAHAASQLGIGGGGRPKTAAAGGGSSSSSTMIEMQEEVLRCKGEVEFYREDAERERRRQKNFTEKVWASETLRYHQKREVVFLLSQVTEAEERELADHLLVRTDDIPGSMPSSPRDGGPLVGTMRPATRG